jgi:tRNA uridine 5-carbamoylmethylation protein Kti12
MKKVVLVRGCSGSGKSTLANKLKKEAIKQNQTCEIFSADDYFIQNDNYNWQGKYIRYAHAWCFGMFSKALFNEINLIIVDNTFIEDWTTYQYIDGATHFDYEWDIVESGTKWAKNVDELVSRNIHNVPRSTIEKMVSGMEKLTTKELKNILNRKFNKSN